MVFSITSVKLKNIAGAVCIAVVSMFSTLAIGQENEKATFTVTETKATAIKPDKPGATSVKVTVKIEIKNDGSDVIGVSSRNFQYKLIKKGKTKDKDEVHPVFGHVDPDIRDARPLEAGKSTTVTAELEGSSVVIDKSAKYELQVNGYGKEKSVPLKFK